jgi:hypothetical protein
VIERGGAWIRTKDQGFADLCLSSWLHRHFYQLFGPSNKIYHIRIFLKTIFYDLENFYDLEKMAMS